MESGREPVLVPQPRIHVRGQRDLTSYFMFQDLEDLADHAWLTFQIHLHNCRVQSRPKECNHKNSSLHRTTSQLDDYHGKIMIKFLVLFFFFIVFMLFTSLFSS
jgi:hypothetical protein